MVIRDSAFIWLLNINPNGLKNKIYIYINKDPLENEMDHLKGLSL